MRTRKRDESIVRDSGFAAYGTVKTDAKHRVVLKGPVFEHYVVYHNKAGQILLDPQVMIPAREAWLWKDKKALASVLRGIKEAAEGKARPWKSFAQYADEKLD